MEVKKLINLLRYLRDFGPEHFELLKESADTIEKLQADIKFLLSFCPKETAEQLQEGLDPTFYQTLTYNGDLNLHKRLDSIRGSTSTEGE